MPSNEKGGTIVGTGNRTYGVSSWLFESRDGHGYGHVIAENHGSITLSGDPLAVGHHWGVVGVQATQEHLTNDDPRGHTGDTIARNTGDIFVTGKRANAISAESYGNGLSVVEITGGNGRRGPRPAKTMASQLKPQCRLPPPKT